MFRLSSLGLVLSLLAGCTKAPEDDSKYTTTVSGLKIQNLREGVGPAAKKGDTVVVHYSGWLAKNGKKFDSSLDRNEPFDFRLGAGQVIPGWEEGLVGMKPGGKRMLLIPSKLAYGERGAGPDIPPNSELRFEVELLEIK